MKKNDVIALISACLGSGIAGACMAKLWFERDMSNEREKINAALDRAEARTKNINDQVDEAVRFVYDTEARNAFDKRLKSMNVESIAEEVCKREIQTIEDSVIRRRIQAEYEDQIRKVMQEELKEYFKTGIKRMIDTDIDSEFIRRTAKTYIKDIVSDQLDDEIEKAIKSCDVDDLMEKAINDCDVEDLIEEYIEDHSSKMNDIFRKAASQIFKEKFDDKFVEKVLESIEESLN